MNNMPTLPSRIPWTVVSPVPPSLVSLISTNDITTSNDKIVNLKNLAVGWRVYTHLFGNTRLASWEIARLGCRRVPIFRLVKGLVRLPVSNQRWMAERL